jgi:PPP family 3-phenylpropionic acid transporter
MLPLGHVVLRFRVVLYLYWAMSAAFLGYWVVNFEATRQITAAEIGIMMSLYTAAALLGQYGWGYLSDRWRSIRLPVVVASLLFAATVATFPWQTSVRALYLSMVLVGLLQQPIGPMIDSWALKHLGVHGEENRFGAVRGFGSLGWATVALLTAYLIQHVSWNSMFAISSVAGLLLALMAAYIPDVRTNAGEPAAGGARVAGELTTARALRQLFGNRAYVYILVVVFLMYLGVQTTFNFQGLLIKGTGGGVAELGWTYFVGVMSEMPAMFLSVWLLPRMPARRLMILSGCLYMLRYALIIYFQTPWVILLTASLEGLAFGLLLTSLRSQVFAVVAEEVQTLAMTIVDAVFLSLTVILGGAVGGWLIEHYSLVHMLAACMASSALSLALLFLGRRYDCPANSRTATLP